MTWDDALFRELLTRLRLSLDSYPTVRSRFYASLYLAEGFAAVRDPAACESLLLQAKHLLPEMDELDQAAALLRFARILLTLGQKERAHEMALRANITSKNDLVPAVHLLSSLGDMPNAKKYFERYHREHGTDAVWTAGLAPLFSLEELFHFAEEATGKIYAHRLGCIVEAVVQHNNSTKIQWFLEYLLAPLADTAIQETRRQNAVALLAMTRQLERAITLWEQTETSKTRINTAILQALLGIGNVERAEELATRTGDRHSWYKIALWHAERGDVVQAGTSLRKGRDLTLVKHRHGMGERAVARLFIERGELAAAEVMLADVQEWHRMPWVVAEANLLAHQDDASGARTILLAAIGKAYGFHRESFRGIFYHNDWVYKLIKTLASIGLIEDALEQYALLEEISPEVMPYEIWVAVARGEALQGRREAAIATIEKVAGLVETPRDVTMGVIVHSLLGGDWDTSHKLRKAVERQSAFFAPSALSFSSNP